MLGMADLIITAMGVILQRLFAAFATWILDAMAGIQVDAYKMADSAATQHVLHLVIPIALALLALRLAYGLAYDYFVWDSAGINTRPTDLVKGLALAIGGMALSTLLVKSVWNFFVTISLGIAGIGVFDRSASLVNMGLQIVIGAATGVGPLLEILVELEYAAAFVLLLIAVFQTFVRVADMALYIVAGPIASIGLINRNQGIWAGWWKGLVVLAASQTTQLFLIYFGFSALASMGIIETTTAHHCAKAATHCTTVHHLKLNLASQITAPLTMIGALIASLKGADFVKQMGGYSTGVGNLVHQHGSTWIGRGPTGGAAGGS